jgi:diguanylate cyclase (GGDEF)-like protein/PAS domain S-box-containing protein
MGTFEYVFRNFGCCQTARCSPDSLSAHLLDFSMSTPVRVLIVHDSNEAAGLLIGELERGGLSPVSEHVASREAFERAVSGPIWDVILSDFRLGDFGALAALSFLKERELDTPFIIVSDNIGEETAVKAIKAGAHNCIPTGAVGRLGAIVERELLEAQIRRERRQARKALRESESRFRTLVETASDAILTVSDSGRILFANPAAERIFGYPVAAMIGEDLTMLVPDFPSLKELVPLPSGEGAQAHAASPRVEWTGRHEGGCELPLDVSIGLFPREGRNLLTLIARDATERKKSERALRDSEERLRTLVNNAPIVLFALDREGVVTHLEGSGLETAGLTSGDVLGRSAFELYRGSPKGLAVLGRALSGEAVRETFDVMGLVFDVELAPRHDPDGKVAGAIGVATNVTRQRRAERAADQSEMRYRLLFEGNLAGVYRTTEDGRILDCNESFAQIFGYGSREEVLSLPAWDLYLTAEDWKATIARLKERGGLTNYEECLRRKDGSHVWVLENGNLLSGKDGKPGIIEGTIIDITERKRAEEKVKHLAFHDSLTGLPNRLLFSDRLRVAMVHANRYRQKLAVLFLDVDRFKVINDSLGHSIGDELLRRIAERVGGCIRQEDTIARLGGDEFTVLLPGIAKEEDAAAIAGKILEAVRLPFFIEHRELFITTSIGVTLYPDDGADPETLVRNADTAMYRAKDQGRDNCQLYAPAMNSRALERLSLEGRLRQALQNRELVLYYQPLIELATGRIRGAEALLRWQHPDLGLVPPGEFISIAEVSGLIVPIGQWVLQTACAQASAWRESGHPLSVAVNLSSRQFQQADLVFQVTEALHQTGLSPSSLDLEITESNAMQNAELSISTLWDLKNLGVSLSMDDFGTGYSSLNYLKRFPIDRIKIDQSFVRDVTRDPDDAAIAAAIIAMAHGLKLTAVAEGVETEAQLAFLRSQECDEMQGYLFSPPVPAARFDELLESSTTLAR